MAPFTPPCLRGALPPQQVPLSYKVMSKRRMDREQGLPRVAPFTPPCLRGVRPPQPLPRSDIRMELGGPRARSATHGSLHSALPTWGSPSAASAPFLQGDEQDVMNGPRARSATHGSLHSALPTWGSPSAASSPSSVDVVATHVH